MDTLECLEIGTLRIRANMNLQCDRRHCSSYDNILEVDH
jgi:hypothetical protein